MVDPFSLVAIGATVGGVAGKFTEKAWIVSRSCNCLVDRTLHGFEMSNFLILFK